MARKYSIGIDLGTTNSVLAYTLLDQDRAEVHILRIEQPVAAGEFESLECLPSFLYALTERELESKALVSSEESSEPWIAGAFARSNAAVAPERTIASAKSWLCNPHVDRNGPILPWDSDDDVERISPVKASTIYLRRLCEAWHRQFPDDPISDQIVSLTVPASFDMAARELTQMAAHEAGLPKDFMLLEEPQAAIYHWIDQMGDRWRSSVTRGDSILICDVGGGTTDLTLIRVEEQQGEMELHRLAVGRHLLVGGDNMDLALAHFAAGRFQQQGIKLNPWQSISLWHACRAAKERLLSSEDATSHTISILGRGSKLIGGTVSIEVSRNEVVDLLLNGFFPQCARTDLPSQENASGFTQLGLPYEQDTSITKHVAAFLADHFNHSDAKRPNRILFNGGAFKSSSLRERLTQVLASWDDAGIAPSVLGGIDALDQAVACGAAYYGWAKEHGGIRIRGGTARSYYVGIESSGLAVPGMPRPLHALCVVPHGMEEGTELSVPGKEVGLIVGKPVRFRFFASATRRNDTVGKLLRHWDEDDLQETAPLELTLPQGESIEEAIVPIQFLSKVTEIGVFELWCRSLRDERTWKLEFNVREGVGTEPT